MSKLTHCPNCGYLFDTHEILNDPRAKPSDGDISMCIKCGNISIFENNTLRAITREELEIIYQRHPEVREEVKRNKLGIDLINQKFYCPQCGAEIKPFVASNPKGSFIEANCAECKARVLTDDLKNLITQDWRNTRS